MIIKNIVFVAVILNVLVLSCGSVVEVYAQSDDTEKQDGLINLTLKGNSLREVIESVSVQTGYRIEISESLLQRPVTGQFSNVEIDHFFRRVFRGMNVFQVINNDAKNIKIYSTARENQKIVVVTPKSLAGDGEHRLDGQPDVTLQDLLDERDELNKNVDVANIPLDETSGVSPGSLSEERKEVFSSIDAGSVSLDKESGVTPADLKKESEEIYKTINVDEVPLDGSGVTPQSLKREREELFNTIDVDAIPLDESSGVTPASLRE